MEIENKILAQAGVIRGNFINHVAFIEKQIELFISYHFCKDFDRAYEMIELLTGDRFVSFESKRAAFQNILERHHANIYAEHKSKFEYLTIIQNHRNKLAHLVPYVGTEAEQRFIKDGAVGFVKFTYNKTKPAWYDQTQLAELSNAVNMVKDLLKIVQNNESPS